MNAKKILAIILSVIFITVSLTSCGFVSIDEPDVTDENGDVIIQTDKNGETTKKPKGVTVTPVPPPAPKFLVGRLEEGRSNPPEANPIETLETGMITVPEGVTI